ncbi:MAG: SpoIID/LytB domain-containing protein [Candidatus Omnitrophica bacterium]|nr:SpoIID/LytB domain-containing protein [Candidatus Omnitrophota bacterium]
MVQRLRECIIAKKRAVWAAAAIIAGFCVFYLFFRSAGPFRGRAGQPFIVRIRVVHNAEKIRLSADAPCRVRDAATGGLLGDGIEMKASAGISPYEGGIKLDDTEFPAGRLRVSVPGGEALTLDGTAYRGEMDIIRTRGGLDAVNRVELEDYLKGVLPCEVNHLWPFAALKAQAIVSRTFAVSQVLLRRRRDYDMTDDTFFQVYGGKTSEKWRTTLAVEKTKNKVLEYNGRIFPAYFHSCCGGHTEDASRLWNEGIPPLKGVRCAWCRWSPYFRWQARVPARVMIRKFKDAGYDIRRVDDIRPGARDISGRLEYLRIRSGNKWFEIKGSDFSRLIGSRVIRSTNLRIKKYPFFYYFSGYGWGHGVGMCQWGAFGLALRWWSAERIVKHYYPGSRIVDLREVI